MRLRQSVDCKVTYRLAAITFSLMPPIGSTRPVNDTSPVIATHAARDGHQYTRVTRNEGEREGERARHIPMSGRTGVLSASDKSEVIIAIPALGPSFGVAPSGTCICTR
jgi:hypothetical protein